MGCNCGNKRALSATGAPATYRLLVNGTQVYENDRRDVVEKMMSRFPSAQSVKILAPGEKA